MIHPHRPQTTAAVATHYDGLDLFYREVWDEHLHHGFWATGRESRPAAVEALVDLIPMMEFLIENTTDPNRISFLVTGVYKFRVGVRRSGSTDTITSADLSLRKDGVNA
jgi:hypothetical protein